MVIRYLQKPFKFEILEKFCDLKTAKILDVGCGNHSPSIAKKYYPCCHYFGLDRSKSYSLGSQDFQAMEQFYEVDLSNDQNLSDIPEKYFDCIIASHIIEHLSHGPVVIKALMRKLAPGGMIYFEFPSPKSLRLPRMKGFLLGGTLNFYDDPTHIRLYERREIESQLIHAGCCVVLSGVRRSFKRIIFLPIYFLWSLIIFRNVTGGIFWDLLGFADFVIAQKKFQSQ